MKSKLFQDILNTFSCMTTVIEDGGIVCMNRKDDPFLADDVYRNLCTASLREISDDVLRPITLKASGETEISTFLSNDAYPLLYLVSETADERLRVVVGPFCVGYSDRRQVHDYARQHHIKVPEAYRIPMLPIFTTLDYLCIVFEYAMDTEVTYSADVYEDFLTAQTKVREPADDALSLFEDDTNYYHSTYEFERAFEHAIINGDRDELANISGYFSMNDVGVVARSSFKQMEYMTVALVTLLSRTAIRAGVSEILSYRISDRFLREIGEQRSPHSLYRICNEIVDTYMREIRSVRSDHVDSLHIERAKNYIRSHCSQPLTVTGTAEAIGVSGSYLSALFRQYEEDSVKHFILKTKLEGAANMLRNSEYDVGAIAEYFCFSSPSHFAMKFKEYYGCTPGAYRKAQ